MGGHVQPRCELRAGDAASRIADAERQLILLFRSAAGVVCEIFDVAGDRIVQQRSCLSVQGRYR